MAPFVEEILWNPGGGEVFPRRSRIVPAWADIHRVEADGAVLVDKLDLRNDRLSELQHSEAEFDPDRLPYVDRGRRAAVLVDHAYRLKLNQLVSRRRRGIVPHDLRPGAHRLLLVMRDDVGRRAVAHDAPLVQQEHAIAELEDALQIV